MALTVSSIAELKELVALLREQGVSRYETPELTLHLEAQTASKKPDEDGESWDELQKRLRQADERAERDDLEAQFAHVPGGVPRELAERLRASRGEEAEA